jgi:hypothetical protein
MTLKKETTMKERQRITWPGDPVDEPQRRHQKEKQEEEARRKRAPQPAVLAKDKEE